MAALTWDENGTRLYETGTKKAVLYPGFTAEAKSNDGTVAPAHFGAGVAWNGITAVTETPAGAEATDLYADDMKYLTLRSAETFGATIEAYMYPPEWGQCDGSADVLAGVTFGQQSRKVFGLCYRSVLGNDTDLDEHGYKLHLIYNATASPSERAYATVNDSPEAITFSWELTTTPINTTVKDANGKVLKPVSCITIDSTQVDKAKLEALEKILYGSDEADARLPLPDEVFTLLGGKLN